MSASTVWRGKAQLRQRGHLTPYHDVTLCHIHTEPVQNADNFAGLDEKPPEKSTEKSSLSVWFFWQTFSLKNRKTDRAIIYRFRFTTLYVWYFCVHGFRLFPLLETSLLDSCMGIFLATLNRFQAFFMVPALETKLLEDWRGFVVGRRQCFHHVSGIFEGKCLE